MLLEKLFRQEQLLSQKLPTFLFFELYSQIQILQNLTVPQADVGIKPRSSMRCLNLDFGQKMRGQLGSVSLLRGHVGLFNS